MPFFLLPFLLLQSNTIEDANEARFEACLDLAIDDAASGVVSANEWLIEGGTYFARHCLGFAYARQGRWDAAESAFVEAAEAAQLASDLRAANLWTQAGNAALAGGSPARALGYFDSALTQGTLDGLLLGETHLDKARALVAMDREDEARAEFAQVHALVPEDPLGWLLSATLARRKGDLETAVSDIGIAAKLAPRDADVALEAGNIAILGGDEAGARKNWALAIDVAPDSAAAKAARANLDQLGAEEVDDGGTPEPAPPPEG